jgi:hypothetical protein
VGAQRHVSVVRNVACVIADAIGHTQGESSQSGTVLVKALRDVYNAVISEKSDTNVRHVQEVRVMDIDLIRRPELPSRALPRMQSPALWRKLQVLSRSKSFSQFSPSSNLNKDAIQVVVLQTGHRTDSCSAKW